MSGDPIDVEELLKRTMNNVRIAERVLKAFESDVGRTADRLAGQMGIAPTAPERLDAAREFVLGQAAKEGHCYLPETELVHRTAELLSLTEAELLARVPELARAGRVARQMPPGPV
ncbi:MAG: helix-hairpin-helix domain-containing protein, partial [Phycisphaerales bacterium]